ncbi:MAG: methyltransferase domain-containing protein [Desulfuromonadales bacterium]
MESDRIKWNHRFESQDSYLGDRPSPFLAREIETVKRLAPGVRALDIACGEGRNSVFLAQHGFRVTGLDISDCGLAKGALRAQAAGVEVDFQQVDLDSSSVEGSYDLIVNFNFLLRGLIAPLVQALVPGGVMLFDTIMASRQMLAAHNPDYLLQRGELLRLFEAFTGEILMSEESDDGDVPTARLMFRKGVPIR